MKDLPITPHDYLEGYKTVYQHGLVMGNKVSQVSWFCSVWGTVSRLWGRERLTYSEQVQLAREQAIDRMMHEAHILDANAITGFGMQTSKVFGRYFEVIVYGVAVEIKPVSLYELSLVK